MLSYTKQIMSCFHEGRDKLPGPPQNVHVIPIDSHSVKIAWEVPVKNPHTVELYRVFWRLVDAPERVPTEKADTAATELKISNLKDGATYECVVKAGNHRGTSTLTSPVRFTVGEKLVMSAASQGEEESHTGVAVAVVLSLVVVAAFIAGAVWFVRTRKMLGIKHTGGVAFENPSYLREVNEHSQVRSEMKCRATFS